MSDNSETGVSEAAATAPVAASIPNTANIPAPSDFKRRSVRCDGSAHDGCQAGCLLFWKLAWLKAADAPADTLSIPSSSGYLWVFGDILRQELESDKSAEFGILGLVDNAHAATAKLLDDAVVRDGLADHAQECYG